MREAQLSARPSPVPDDESRPFFEAANRSELFIRHCPACGAFAWPTPRLNTCQICLTPGLEWEQVSGRGIVHSITRVHSVAQDEDPDWAPFSVGVIELVEGVRTSIVGVLPSDGLHVNVGDPVVVVFHATRDGQRVPWFEATDPHVASQKEIP